MNSRLQAAIDINKECFTSDDTYSDYNYVKALLNGNVRLLTISHKGEVVGYMLYSIHATHLESLRRGLTKKARGKGLGMKITRKLIAVANKMEKDIFTYVAKSNMPSLNSNVRCGYTIEQIGEDWIYIRHKYRG